MSLPSPSQGEDRRGSRSTQLGLRAESQKSGSQTAGKSAYLGVMKSEVNV